MMMTPREAEALSVVHLRIVTVLDEVRVGVPPDRDAAFDHLRRLLAAAMAAERLWQQPGSVLVHQRGRAPNHAAIAASVAYLEQAHLAREVGVLALEIRERFFGGSIGILSDDAPSRCFAHRDGAIVVDLAPRLVRRGRLFVRDDGCFDLWLARG